MKVCCVGRKAKKGKTVLSLVTELTPFPGEERELGASMKPDGTALPGTSGPKIGPPGLHLRPWSWRLCVFRVFADGADFLNIDSTSHINNIRVQLEAGVGMRMGQLKSPWFRGRMLDVGLFILFARYSDSPPKPPLGLGRELR